MENKQKFEKEEMMLKDLIECGFKNYKNFNKNFEIYLEENIEKIYDDYYDAESNGFKLQHSVDIKNIILRDNLKVNKKLTEVEEPHSHRRVFVNELDEELELVYQHENLDCIAEMLEDVTLEDLYAYISFYGSWEIHLSKDEVGNVLYSLMQYSI